MISVKLSFLTFLFSAIPIQAAMCNALKDPGNIVDTVKIGLLIQDNKSFAARDGASLAILKANEQDPGKKIAFSLVVRSMEGPWGTGSKQVTSLIFDDKVVALIGSHDGRNAHLAEQVATKVQVVFISVWSGDPTLAQAFVPWYFSCTPNNDRQAETLYSEIYLKKHLSGVVFISDKSYDSNMAFRSFNKKTEESGRKKPVQLIFDGSDTGCRNIIDAIKINKPDCIILSGEPSSASILIGQLRRLNIQTPLYGTLSLLDENELKEEDLKKYESCSVITSGHWFGTSGNNFRKEFYGKFGYYPGAVASYAYDGTRILIEAVRNAGTSRENIQTYLSGIKYRGATGEIKFDSKGNRQGSAIIMNIKNGIPVRVGE
jgi:branched-chain amino acid transport system substrate-binding protein